MALIGSRPCVRISVLSGRVTSTDATPNRNSDTFGHLPWLADYLRSIPALGAKMKQMRAYCIERAQQRVKLGSTTRKDLFYYLVRIPPLVTTQGSYRSDAFLEQRRWRGADATAPRGHRRWDLGHRRGCRHNFERALEYLLLSSYPSRNIWPLARRSGSILPP